MTNWMDRWLRVTLEQRAAGTLPVPCLDAETAAAFADDTLSADERSRAEAHLADCARCQALLAALITVTPSGSERAWWRRPAIAWLVPAAVAATAIVVWVNIPRRSEMTPPTQVVPHAAPPPTATRSAAPPQAAPPAPAEADAQARNSTIGAITAAPPRVAGEARRRSEPALPSTEMSQAISAPQAAPSVAADARQSAAEPAAEAPIAETVTITGMSERMLSRQLDAAPERTIVSSDPISRWRLGAAGVVHHSRDGGRTWQTHPTGVNATLTAGASPSPAVCWVVGLKGTILISTDEGRSWQRVPFPETADLVSIRAADDRTATVTTIDAQTFTTSDRGLTWR